MNDAPETKPVVEILRLTGSYFLMTASSIGRGNSPVDIRWISLTCILDCRWKLDTLQRPVLFKIFSDNAYTRLDHFAWRSSSTDEEQ